MATTHRYHPTDIQIAFHESEAFVRGYGGAMGGGKSRAICEEALRIAVEHPGCPIVIARQSHTSIKETTRKTMVEQVLPPDWIAAKKQSMGEDWIDLHNGSRIHFIGLDDPVRWFSAEIGVLIVDQVEEVAEDTVVKMISRLRHQKGPVTVLPDGEEIIGKVILSFNPAHPGHWLQRWFILDAEPTEHGSSKDDLYATDAEEPLGNADFFKALPAQNPHLPPGYIRRVIGGLPAMLRRMYRDGEWLYLTGSCHFDVDALTWYTDKAVRKPEFRCDFRVTAPTEATIRKSRGGRISVYRKPVPGRKYAIGADVATGRGKDFSCAYVIDLATMELAAEFHAKIDEDLFAQQLHFLGKWYATALIAVELGGGYGDAVIIALRDGKEGRPPYPKLYRHVTSTRMDLPTAKPFGYPVSVKTRPLLISGLEKALRERALPWVTSGLLGECQTFIDAETNPSPRAQDGCNDDRVMAACLALEMYRLRGEHPHDIRKVLRRRARKPVAAYPWQQVNA